jgi:hypothetical protein
MPYKLIKGTFHLTGRSPAGNATGFSPDGDSMQFRPNTPAHLDGLEQAGHPYELNQDREPHLRFEGIDATEMYYGGSRQPSPQAEDARDYLTGASVALESAFVTAYRQLGVTRRPGGRE